MAEANVEMVAYAPLDDPIAGHVEPGDENGGLFTTTEQQAKFYRKANWAGAPGTDPRDIQLEVAVEEFEKKKDARSQAAQARQVFRNLSLHSAQRGNVAAADVMPRGFMLQQGEAARTNAQENEVEGGDTELIPQQNAEATESSDSENQSDDYGEWTVPQLRAEHKRRELEGGSGANKAQLIDDLEADDAKKASDNK